MLEIGIRVNGAGLLQRLRRGVMTPVDSSQLLVVCASPPEGVAYAFRCFQYGA